MLSRTIGQDTIRLIFHSTCVFPHFFGIKLTFERVSDAWTGVIFCRRSTRVGATNPRPLTLRGLVATTATCATLTRTRSCRIFTATETTAHLLQVKVWAPTSQRIPASFQTKLKNNNFTFVFFFLVFSNRVVFFSVSFNNTVISRPLVSSRPRSPNPHNLGLAIEIFLGGCFLHIPLGIFFRIPFRKCETYSTLRTIKKYTWNPLMMFLHSSKLFFYGKPVIFILILKWLVVDLGVWTKTCSCPIITPCSAIVSTRLITPSSWNAAKAKTFATANSPRN